MGEEDRSRDGAGAGEEVGQGPGSDRDREQEGQGRGGQGGQAALADALPLLLVADAPPQVGRLCVSAQLLRRHAAQGMAVGRVWANYGPGTTCWPAERFILACRTLRNDFNSK